MYLILQKFKLVMMHIKMKNQMLTKNILRNIVYECGCGNFWSAEQNCLIGLLLETCFDLKYGLIIKPLLCIF